MSVPLAFAAMSGDEREQINVPQDALDAMHRHSFDCFPEEMCGLLVGLPGSNSVVRFVPTTNVAHSARVYTIDPKELMRADMAAEDEGLAIIGCVHSHTHTPAYPSPTDVAAAPDPAWHYLIVTLETGEAAARSYRIVGETITETAISAL